MQARIIEPVSKLDNPRVPQEAGAGAASCRTMTRRLRAYARDSWRRTGIYGMPVRRALLAALSKLMWI